MTTNNANNDPATNGPGTTAGNGQTPNATTTTTGSNNTNRGRYHNNNRYGSSRSQFTPKLTDVESLATTKENRGQDFAKFTKSLHHYVLTNFKRSKDLSKAITEFQDPHQLIKQDTKTLTSIRQEYNLHLKIGPKNETEEEKEIREMENYDNLEMAKTLYSSYVKEQSDRRQILSQNLTILWATI